MASYALTCCSTADLTHEQFVARDIQYVCFHFTLNGETYPDDLGQSMPFPIFYQAMANGAETSTSQVNISEYLELFTPILESGKDILHVCLSSGLSGSCWSAARRVCRARISSCCCAESVCSTAARASFSLACRASPQVAEGCMRMLAV